MQCNNSVLRIVSINLIDNQSFIAARLKEMQKCSLLVEFVYHAFIECYALGHDVCNTKGWLLKLNK